MVDFTGAAVERAFGLLFELVTDAVNTVATFGPELKKIESTLIKIEPIIKQWDEYNRRLDGSPKELAPINDLFVKGKGLVQKCSRINRFNIRKKHKYSNRLTEFDAEVLREFQTYLPLVHVIITKATSLNAKETGEDVLEIKGVVKETGGDVKEIMGDVKEIMGDVKETGGDVKEIKWEVKETGGEVREMKEDLKKVMDLLFSGQANSRAPLSVLEPFGNLAIPKAPDCIVGSEVKASLRELKERLLEKGMSVIVVTAPGGCGKSTLLTELCHDVAIKGKFNGKIMFVRVSKKPNLIDIVRKMAGHNGFEVAEIKTEDHAVQCLQQLLIRIGHDPVLLVLDDVWADSQSIIEKFVVKEIKHYKIVVTSRYEFPNIGLVHHLNPLPPGEARDLFSLSVTVDGRCLVEPDDELWDKIVNRCKGLPLALTVVAKSLRGMDRAFWETKLLDWSSSGMDSDILDCLRKSLDDLDGDPSIKERFMDLGSFPEDRKIPATALIDMWVELYKLDFDGVRAMADLNKLVYRNLADLVTRTDSSEDEDKCYSSHYAMQHDLLRELAMMECDRGEVEKRERLILDLTGDNSSDWWSEQKQPSLGARLVSIYTDGTFSRPWPNLQLPEAAALVLNFETNMQTKTYALPEFVGTADKLKALIVTNYSLFPAELHNFRVLGSSLRRIRLERVTVPLLSMGKLCLHSLQKISLSMCNISQASTSDSAKISNAMPNLVEFNIDYCDDLKKLPDGMCEIKPLKKLSITNCHNLSALPQQIGELMSLEVVRLTSCTSLSKLPDSIGALKKLISLNISDCLSLRTLPSQIGNLINLKRMNMRGCLRLSVLPRSIVKLRNLRKVVCDKEKDITWEPLKRSLNGLNIIASEEEANLDWLHD